jgi:hypothetical protein
VSTSRYSRSGWKIQATISAGQSAAALHRAIVTTRAGQPAPAKHQLGRVYAKLSAHDRRAPAKR